MLNLLTNYSYVYEYSENNPYEVEFLPGTYKFECWGASGGPTFGSNGGYTKGELSLNQKTIFYFYLGESGKSSIFDHDLFNGGGKGQYTGGGATDIRTEKGTSWNDFESLKSRIMVAGGGAGGDYGDKGGAAGGLNGFNSEHNNGKGGTQFEGGNGIVSGSFGCGGGDSNQYKDGNGGGVVDILEVDLVQFLEIKEVEEDLHSFLAMMVVTQLKKNQHSTTLFLNPIPIIIQVTYLKIQK